MAKTKSDTTTTTSESTALAASTPSSLVRADMLDGLDVGTTGLEQVDASDRRLASVTLNFNGVIGNDVPPKSMWVNTVTEEMNREMTLVMLVLHKSRLWQEFVQGEGNKRRCSSWDQITGTMEDGTQRPCKGCKDAQWQTINGKKHRNCGEVHNVVAIDRASNELVMLRSKKTALDPWRAFLNKLFLGKRMVNGRRCDAPLFIYETKIGAEMVQSKSGTYAVPTFDVVRDEKGEPKVLPREEIMFLADSARAVIELYLDRHAREVADNDDARGAGDEGAIDTSFEFGANDKFADPSKTANAAIETQQRFG